MRHGMMVAAFGALLALTVGCGDSGISYPIDDGGWQIGVTLGEIPPRLYDASVLISVQADVINFTDGERPPDGSPVVFNTSGGSYPNGLTEIELGTVEGRAITELEIQLPGTYQVEIEYPQGSCTVITEFSVGLE